MHDWQKFAICVQTCLESSKTPRTSLGELTTLPDPLVGWEGCPRHFLTPRLLRRLDSRRLRCLELARSPTFQTKVTPMHQVYYRQNNWLLRQRCLVLHPILLHLSDKLVFDTGAAVPGPVPLMQGPLQLDSRFQPNFAPSMLMVASCGNFVPSFYGWSHEAKHFKFDT